LDRSTSNAEKEKYTATLFSERRKMSGSTCISFRVTPQSDSNPCTARQSQCLRPQKQKLDSQPALHRNIPTSTLLLHPSNLIRRPHRSSPPIRSRNQRSIFLPQCSPITKSVRCRTMSLVRVRKLANLDYLYFLLTQVVRHIAGLFRVASLTFFECHFGSASACRVCVCGDGGWWWWRSKRYSVTLNVAIGCCDVWEMFLELLFDYFGDFFNHAT